ncbi:MAG TPA: family 1 glycosylhydrolase, partial [Candidatus Acidoferrales bacterium]|nr:family 1 glycosylhydrolase [Candidatus Acidoferrales bacterium]
MTRSRSISHDFTRREFLSASGASALALTNLRPADATLTHPAENPIGQASLAPPAVSSFPKNFLWGASTSAYQIEGAAREDGKGLSVWDEFVQQPGKIRDGQTGDVACDFYHRYAEDIAHMRGMGLTAFRFSVSWTRVLPEGVGSVNQKGIDFYSRLVDALLAAGIVPVVTLFHWDTPLALHRRGGWLSRDMA